MNKNGLFDFETEIEEVKSTEADWTFIIVGYVLLACGLVFIGMVTGYDQRIAEMVITPLITK